MCMVGPLTPLPVRTSVVECVLTVVPLMLMGRAHCDGLLLVVLVR